MQTRKTHINFGILKIFERFQIFFFALHGPQNTLYQCGTLTPQIACTLILPHGFTGCISQNCMYVQKIMQSCIDYHAELRRIMRLQLHLTEKKFRKNCAPISRGYHLKRGHVFNYQNFSLS